MPALFDMSYLKEVSKGNVLFMTEMIQIFLLKTPETLIILEKAIADKDWENVGFYAHKLKATYAYVGMDEMRKILVDIEKSAKNLENVELIYSKYEYLAKSTQTALGEILQYKIELESTL